VTLNVLYVHHAGPYGGASRSLMELIAAFPRGTVAPHVVVPRGAVASMLRAAGVPVLEARGIAQFDCTRYGHYRGLRWLILLRELWYLPFTRIAIARARRRWPRIDLVHVNELTQIPSLVWAKRLFGAPVVVHARSVLAGNAIPRRTHRLARLVARHADRVIAIDETVRASLPEGMRAEVVHNGFAPGLEAGSPGPNPLAHLPPHSLKVAMVGSLSPMKGVYEMVEAVRVLAGRGVEVDLIFVGAEVRELAGVRGWLLRRLGFARPVREELERFVAGHGLSRRVHFLGFTTDIRAIYDAIDVVAFPSHLDAVGRPVFEAAFSGVPSIVAMNDPRPDTLIDGETGLCIPALDAEALAGAIERLHRDRALLERMGENARALAFRNFDVRTNAARVLDIYRTLCTPAAGG